MHEKCPPLCCGTERKRQMPPVYHQSVLMILRFIPSSVAGSPTLSPPPTMTDYDGVPSSGLLKEQLPAALELAHTSRGEVLLLFDSISKRMEVCPSLGPTHALGYIWNDYRLVSSRFIVIYDTIYNISVYP